MMLSLRLVLLLFLVSLSFAQQTFDRSIPSKPIYLRSTTGDDSYIATPVPPLATYERGDCHILDVDTSNTGLATIAISGLAAKDILTRFGGALSTGAIVADQPVTICYNGTGYIIQGDGPALPLVVTRGGTGVGVLTGIVQGNGSGNFTAISSSTVGQVIRVTGFESYVWGALDLADTDAVTGILDDANGGTSNGFFTVSGPATSSKTYTFPNVSSTVLTTNDLVTVAQGGSGVGTITGILNGNGTSAFTAATVGTDYGTPDATTKTLTNTTIDCEATGNDCGTVPKIILDFASCVNGAAFNSWDDADGAVVEPTAACNDTGTLKRATADFSGSAVNTVMRTIKLPSDWASGKAVDIIIRYVSTAAAPTGNVEFDISTICRTVGETWDAAFNTAQTITDAQVAQNTLNDATQTSVTMTTCAAGEDLTIQVSRDGVNDTSNDLANALYLELTLRRTQ